MKRLLRCALLAAQLAACHHESAGQAQAKALLDRGVAAYQKADYAAAWPLFEEAAQAGHMKAPRYLGLMYLHGNGIAADAAQAFAQFQNDRALPLKSHPLGGFCLFRLFAGGRSIRGWGRCCRRISRWRYVRKHRRRSPRLRF